MIKYTITMGIRIVCIALCLFVEGWWLLLCVAGAVFLPWVAVVIANAADARTTSVERPGTIERPTTVGQSGTATPQDGDDPTKAHP